MSARELLDGYQVKALEYLVAVAYLLLFVPFWRFVNAGVAPRATQPARAPARRAFEWFAVPDGLRFHPGHAWARGNGGDLVTVGVDDFARRLVGPLTAVQLPALGAAVRQGEAALELVADGKRIPMLSPLDGTVVAVNEDALAHPEAVSEDPYGRGWLFRVRPDRWATGVKQLLSDGLARRWMEGVGDRLRGEMSQELGLLLQDGGQPVQGIARELRPDRWDELARSYLLS